MYGKMWYKRDSSGHRAGGVTVVLVPISLTEHQSQFLYHNITFALFYIISWSKVSSARRCSMSLSRTPQRTLSTWELLLKHRRIAANCTIYICHNQLVSLLSWWMWKNPSACFLPHDGPCTLYRPLPACVAFSLSHVRPIQSQQHMLNCSYTKCEAPGQRPQKIGKSRLFLLQFLAEVITATIKRTNECDRNHSDYYWLFCVTPV